MPSAVGRTLIRLLMTVYSLFIGKKVVTSFKPEIETDHLGHKKVPASESDIW